MNATNVIDATDAWVHTEAEAPSEVTPQRSFSFEFHGSGAEYFRIWIVNLLLTLLTLGIFSAWAKVRRQRYFYGNTLLDGHAFAYHGRPMAILRGRLIVFAGYVTAFLATQFFPVLLWGVIPLAAVGLPWILMRSRRFQLRMTSWRNVRFDFQGRYLPAVNAFIGWYLITAAVLMLIAFVIPRPWLLGAAALVLSLAYPFWVYKRVEYSLENAEYGNAHFSFLTSVRRFFGICLATAAISLVAYLLWFFVLMNSGLLAMRSATQAMELISLLLEAGPKGWGLLLLAGLTGFAIAGMYRAWLLNASFGGVMIHQHRLRSRVHPAELARIKTTNLLGMVLTLGLFFPFAKVRQIRYQLSCMTLEGSGRFEEIHAVSSADTNALGEEAGDFFDVDLGL